MKDINGIEIKVGDIVAVTDSYFKGHNGLYFVDKIEGTPGWSGGISLIKISKKGAISTAKYNSQSWPLFISCSDYFKARDAREYNKTNAKIAVVDNVDKGEIVAYFDNELAKTIEQKQHYEVMYGASHSSVTMLADMIKDYQKTIDRLVA